MVLQRRDGKMARLKQTCGPEEESSLEKDSMKCGSGAGRGVTSSAPPLSIPRPQFLELPLHQHCNTRNGLSKAQHCALTRPSGWRRVAIVTRASRSSPCTHANGCPSFTHRRPPHHIHRNTLARWHTGRSCRPASWQLDTDRGERDNRLCWCAATLLCGRGGGARTQGTCGWHGGGLGARATWHSRGQERREEERSQRKVGEDEDCVAL